MALKSLISMINKYNKISILKNFLYKSVYLQVIYFSKVLNNLNEFMLKKHLLNYRKS